MTRRSRLLPALVLTLTAALAATLPARSATSGFILCRCAFCAANPDVVCRVSPSGFSTLCAGFVLRFCPATGS